jgi:hypothetical protein
MLAFGSEEIVDSWLVKEEKWGVGREQVRCGKRRRSEIRKGNNDVSSSYEPRTRQ